MLYHNIVNRVLKRICLRPVLVAKSTAYVLRTMNTCSRFSVFNCFITVRVFRQQHTLDIKWNFCYKQPQSLSRYAAVPMEVKVTHRCRVATSIDGPFVCYNIIVFNRSFRLAKSIDCGCTSYYTYAVIIIIIITYIETLVTVSHYIIFIRGLMDLSKSLF